MLYAKCPCRDGEKCELARRVAAAKREHRLPKSLVDQFRSQDPRRCHALMQELLDGIGACKRSSRESGHKINYFPGMLRDALRERWADDYRLLDEQAQRKAQRPAATNEPEPPPVEPPPAWAELLANLPGVTAELVELWLKPLTVELQGSHVVLNAPNRCVGEWLQGPGQHLLARITSLSTFALRLMMSASSG